MSECDETQHLAVGAGSPADPDPLDEPEHLDEPHTTGGARVTRAELPAGPPDGDAPDSPGDVAQAVADFLDDVVERPVDGAIEEPGAGR